MKNKIFIFSFGLIAGLTIGVLFSVAIKELIVQFKELHISLNKINLRQSQLSQRLDSIQGKLVPDTKKMAPTITPTPAKTQGQNMVKNTISQENTKDENTANSATLNSTTTEDDSNVVVMTNQLISVLSVRLHNNDTNSVNKKSEETDSALASMSDVDAPKGPTSYRIEFWKSPLNYKGYKMSEGKIVLYGINPVTPVNLITNEDTYYIVVNQAAYHIDFTDDYKPFEKVTDKATLKKLGI